MLLVGVIGLVANVVSLAILAGGREANLNMKAAFLEVANDALGSLAVIVAAGAEWAFGWARADAVASLLIAVLMAPRALTLLRRSVAILMEQAPASVDVAKLRAHMLGVNGVLGVHDLHVAAVFLAPRDRHRARDRHARGRRAFARPHHPRAGRMRVPPLPHRALHVPARMPRTREPRAHGALSDASSPHTARRRERQLPLPPPDTT